jgi:chromosome segregation ATPase
MNFLIDNWLGIMGVLSAPIMWILGGRAAKAQELKKGAVEIEITEVDYAAKVRELYDNLNSKLAQENETLKSDKNEIIAEFKTEKEYFRSQIDELRAQTTIMQGQFNSIQIAYAKEVEQSQNWEKLHRELLEKYNKLTELYDKLKEDFDKHKKQKA